jgi:hypothetical protein
MAAADLAEEPAGTAEAAEVVEASGDEAAASAEEEDEVGAAPMAGEAFAAGFVVAGATKTRAANYAKVKS